ncbi:MAG: hypothetical protein BWZ10_00392 [candidate division BRC1 bacterium ADurb.BinA364]|nr:MAG: hypothetical protein BWZ10_00392 [candidate division BRC1 bacterium ADurb.BinA364]
MTGHGLNQAASWVTVILFGEVTRRALKTMSKQNLVILLHAAHVMMAGHVLFPGGPFGNMVYRAYLVGSDAARDAGMVGSFPTWFAPPFDSDAIAERLFFHRDWIVPIGIAAFIMAIGFVKKYTMGYFFFRLTSDIENLPFPLAPIRAQGAMALAEADEHVKADEAAKGLGKPGERKKSMRWRIFSLGASIGIAFGMFQVGIPAITGLFLTKPFFLIPQPFVDTTTLTEGILPATPTGVTIEIGAILLGFVLPFWSVMGTFIAIVLTIVLNPILYHSGILYHWQPGMNTVNTTFSNSIDFWMSFGIGSGVGIALVCIYATIRDVRSKMRELRAKQQAGKPRENIWATPDKGRGDYPLWIALALYVVAASAMVALCAILLPRTWNVFFFLIFFAFLYNPLISYVNARLLGISGQNVDIPHIKEAVFLLSGAKGIDIWLAPVPLDNFGDQAQAFRVNELTGVTFWSLMKTDLVALPILFVLSMTFWGFIWHSDAVPSDLFPAAQIQWELSAKNNVLLYSSTFVAPGDDPSEKSIMDTEFMRAIHPKVIGVGLFGTIALYTVLSFFGLPIMLIYGMIRGFGNLPHFMVLEIVGALLSRYYFQKKYGPQNFLRMAPTLLAGYFTGVGLIGMATIALKLIKAAVSAAPF